MIKALDRVVMYVTSLWEWRGSLCIDDDVGYDALFTSDKDGAIPCIEVEGMAHVRRTLFTLHTVNESAMAAEALQRIQML
jgi:hypothetical protein